MLRRSSGYADARRFQRRRAVLADQASGTVTCRVEDWLVRIRFWSEWLPR